MASTLEIMKQARVAEAALGKSEYSIDSALNAMADEIVKKSDVILAANLEDIRASVGVISEVMLDRLRLTEKRIQEMAEGIRSIAALPSPLYEITETREMPNGLIIQKQTVPIGVIAIIYESRPNVTADAAALALKSGNAVILRSGKEAYRTSRAIVDAMAAAVESAGMPRGVIQLVDDTSRDSANELMRGRGYIDLLIPRGGAGLIRACVENATVPCIETGTGICHVYIDKHADINKAISILDNAKTSRPSVCNAAEVCLVHREIADRILPLIKDKLVSERQSAGLVPVELKLDARAARIIEGTPMTDADFDTEFLDYKLALGIVDSIDDAIRHIAMHSTHHSEAIITESREAEDRFLRGVDSACVYVNASTRFTDGGEFGLGCEMGISTQKLHARGPMGIRELTTYKYLVRGNGQVR